MKTKKIKEIIKKEKKRVSKKAIKKIESYLEDKTKELIKKAIRNANFSGRKTIREEDIEIQ